MEWMILPFKRYADFSGRSRRLEYWLFSLFYTLVTIVLLGLGFGFAAASAGGTEGEIGAAFGIFLILWLIFALASFIPGLAVAVRRFHDQDKSGWFVLLYFVPYLGALIMLVFMCIEGTRGDNRYGPDPKGRIDASVFA